MTRIGLVSDTHDRVPAALHDALAGVEEILHAGDLCSGDVLVELGTIAPVTAVHGNMDRRPLVERLPEELLLERGGLRIALLHGHTLPGLRLDDLIAKYRVLAPDVVVYGHTHAALSKEWEGTRYVNPGTAGGVGAAATCAILAVEGGAATVEHVSL